MADALKKTIFSKTVSGTTQPAGQFNTGLGSGWTVLAIKSSPYIGLAQLSGSTWWGFLKKWDLSSPGEVEYTAIVYYCSAS